jgi:uncharacterized protein YecT (DUF1311 family)
MLILIDAAAAATNLIVNIRISPMNHQSMLFVVLALCAVNAQANAPVPDKTDDAGLRSSYSKCIDAAAGVTLAMQSCMKVEHAYQDKRLNAAYKELRSLLHKDKQAKLRADERIWLAYRKSHCAKDPDAGQADALSSFDCSILETAKQATSLENRSSIERLKQ